MEATYEFQTPIKRFIEKKKSIESYHPSPITIPASPLLETLGNGTGVMVYRFQRKSKQGDERSPWAVKKATRLATQENDQTSTKMRERLQAEASILQRLDHPNIVKFKGFFQCPSLQDTCLSMEICGRSLLDEIEEHADNGTSFTKNQITLMAWGISKALNYIHNVHKILHGDIKSGNVLVSNDFQSVKLGDFGHSIQLNDDLTNLKNENESYVGTEPWNPKEILDGGNVTDKADIYPYGLVIWEMMTLKIPHVDDVTVEEEDKNDSVSDVSFFSDEDNDDKYYSLLGTRPPLPQRFTADKDLTCMIDLFTYCTHEESSERPNAAEIVTIVNTEVKKEKLCTKNWEVVDLS